MLVGATAVAQPKSAGAPDAKLIEDLFAANRVLVDLGVLDGFGHVSVRHDKDANRYLMARSMAPALVKAEADIMEFDLDGARSTPEHGRSSSASSTARSTGRAPTSMPSCTATRHVIPFGLATRHA